MNDAHPAAAIPEPSAPVKPHRRSLPLRVGTRASPLARVQTRAFLARLADACPMLHAPMFDGHPVFEEHPIHTTGDLVQDRALAEIGGKALFAKEIHEALATGRIDCAVHSLKDLETVLPPGIVLACTLPREDARDALILPAGHQADLSDPYACLPARARIGSASVRRQAQLLHARPDLRFTALRGNVQTRLDKLARGDCDATLLALAGLRRLDLATPYTLVLDPAIMVPAAGQGIIAITVRADDTDLRDLLAAIEDRDARAVASAERALLHALDGSCRTPIGGFARLLPDGRLHLTGLVARADGSFLIKRSATGASGDAAQLGEALGQALRAASPADVFAC